MSFLNRVLLPSFVECGPDYLATDNVIPSRLSELDKV